MIPVPDDKTKLYAESQPDARLGGLAAGATAGCRLGSFLPDRAILRPDQSAPSSSVVGVRPIAIVAPECGIGDGDAETPFTAAMGRTFSGSIGGAVGNTIGGAMAEVYGTKLLELWVSRGFGMTNEPRQMLQVALFPIHSRPTCSTALQPGHWRVKS
jgi:hypothetical protein